MIEKLKTIYKKSSTGKILEWYLEIEDDKYRTISGQQKGKCSISAWRIALPKNVGKKNATTGPEQARLECISKYEKKLAQGGYSEMITQIDEVKFIKPMLAQKYEDRVPTEKMYSEELVIIQPKVDGVRCICTKNGMTTRQGKIIPGAPHIMEALKPVFKNNPDLILDGELYNHKLKDNFNEIISLVRKEKPDEERRLKSKNLIQYHMYDLISDSVYTERFNTLINLIPDNDLVLKVVKASIVNNEEHLLSSYEEFINQGYEGAMVRINNVGYEHKRSKSLLKIKKFVDEEFQIVELLEGEGNNSGMVGKVKLLTKNGKEFGANMTGSWDECVKLLKIKDEYINGEATIKYFELTPDGIPRFPVVVYLYKEKRDI